MTQDIDFFDNQYAGGKRTETAAQEKSKTKQFLAEALPTKDVKKYGISKPTRIVVRGRVAK